MINQHAIDYFWKKNLVRTNIFKTNRSKTEKKFKIKVCGLNFSQKFMHHRHTIMLTSSNYVLMGRNSAIEDYIHLMYHQKYHGF